MYRSSEASSTRCSLKKWYTLPTQNSSSGIARNSSINWSIDSTRTSVSTLIIQLLHNWTHHGPARQVAKNSMGRYFDDYFFPKERTRATTAAISSSDNLALNAGMSFPLPFLVDSESWASVLDFCHAASVKSGWPLDRMFGIPRPSFP